MARIHRTVQKSHNVLDNHDDVATHPEPDILECEVKWGLGSITGNKARGSDRIPDELFKILKGDAVKVLHSVCHKFRKLSNGQGLKKFSFHFNPKEGQAQRIFTLPYNWAPSPLTRSAGVL